MGAIRSGGDPQKRGFARPIRPDNARHCVRREKARRHILQHPLFAPTINWIFVISSMAQPSGADDCRAAKLCSDVKSRRHYLRRLQQARPRPIEKMIAIDQIDLTIFDGAQICANPYCRAKFPILAAARSIEKTARADQNHIRDRRRQYQPCVTMGE